MRIDKIRYGFATNSSSMHSILFRAERGAAPVSHSGEYGWEYFHLIDKEQKEDYLGYQVASNLCPELSAQVQKALVHKFTGLTIRSISIDTDRDFSGIDHQSVWALPHRFAEPVLHIPFIKFLKQEIVDRAHVTIAGGNDNADHAVHRAQIGKHEGVLFSKIPKDRGRMPEFVCKQDREHFILFNRSTGTKVRYSAIDGPEYTASNTPELIDLKITDYCDRGCTFCYQDSTRRGKHASTEVIFQIIDKLAEAEVFEIAIGGGEPTLHPDFCEILKYAHHKNIIPNFTTFDMQFSTNPAIAKAVNNYAGGFAVSSFKDDIPERLREWNERSFGSAAMRRGRKAVHGSLQIPLGCYPKEVVQQIFKFARENFVRVTLLGYKHFGRGIAYKKHDYNDWIIPIIKEYLNEAPATQLGADTVFVQQFREELRELGVPELYIVDNEGAFSCYIDAVEQKIGQCSYADDLHEFDLNNIWGHYPYVEV